MLDLVGNPEDRFSHNEAQIFVVTGISIEQLLRNQSQWNTVITTVPIGLALVLFPYVQLWK